MTSYQRYVILRQAKYYRECPPPALWTGLKKINPYILITVLVVIFYELCLVFCFSDYLSLLCLLLTLVFSVLVIPVLTYINTFGIFHDVLSDYVDVGVIEFNVIRCCCLTLLVVFISAFLLALDIGGSLGSLVVLSLVIIQFVCGYIYFHAEIAVIVRARTLMLQVLLCSVQLCRIENGREENYGVNPANGLPMINHAVDVLGNPRGFVINGDLSGVSERVHRDEILNEFYGVNPANGIPMANESNDVLGNPMGFDLNNDSNGYNNPFS